MYLEKKLAEFTQKKAKETEAKFEKDKLQIYKLEPYNAE